MRTWKGPRLATCDLPAAPSKGGEIAGEATCSSPKQVDRGVPRLPSKEVVQTPASMRAMATSGHVCNSSGVAHGVKAALGDSRKRLRSAQGQPVGGYRPPTAYFIYGYLRAMRTQCPEKSSGIADILRENKQDGETIRCEATMFDATQFRLLIRQARLGDQDAASSTVFVLPRSLAEGNVGLSLELASHHRRLASLDARCRNRQRELAAFSRDDIQLVLECCKCRLHGLCRSHGLPSWNETQANEVMAEQR